MIPIRTVLPGDRDVAGVVVNRDELLTKLEDNRKNHRALFEEAMDAYTKKVEKELERRLQDIREGRQPDIVIELIRPEDHTKDYDRIITMVQMSVEPMLDLSEMEFAQYVLDQWAWRGQFAMSYMSNTGKGL